MGRWRKLENPPIGDWGLFLKWAKDSKRDGIRYKVRDYNGIRYLKYKDNGELFRYWLRTWPSDAVVVSASYFYKAEYCPEEEARKYGIGEYIWVRHLENCDARQWFIDNISPEWECLDRIEIDERNWVAEHFNRTINIFQQVFVLYFKSKADTIKYKLIFGNDS